MLLTVTGVYRERSKQSENLCSFQRILVIVPSGSGFCIKNEMLHINNVTMPQIKTAFKSIAVPTPAPIPTPSTVVATSAPSSRDDATKLQMIQLMSQRSNMNLEWSEK